MATVTKPLALNESLNSTENTPRNIADVLADELDGIKQAISSQSGSGDGHIIQNSSGANMPQENTMQFTDAHLTDDSVGGKTVIENFKAVTEAEYSSETEDGAYIITDGDGATIGEASDDYVEVVADGVKTTADLLNELYALIDKTKLTKESALVRKGTFGTEVYYVSQWTSSRIETALTQVSSSAVAIINFVLTASTSKAYFYQGSTPQDISSNTQNSGVVFALYYGNKKATVDLQTTANRCLMSDGTSLQIKTKILTNPTCASNGAIETDLTSDKIIVSVFADIQIARIYLGGIYDGKYYLQSANFSSGSINKSTTLNGNVTIQYFG